MEDRVLLGHLRIKAVVRQICLERERIPSAKLVHFWGWIPHPQGLNRDNHSVVGSVSIIKHRVIARIYLGWEEAKLFFCRRYLSAWKS